MIDYGGTTMARQNSLHSIGRFSSFSFPARIVLTLVLLVGLLGLFPVVSTLAALDPGTLDTGFDPGSVANNSIYAMVVQPDGKILIGGDLTNRIARLNADGSADSLFNNNVIGRLDGRVLALAVQSDGKILVGGEFSNPHN